MNTDADTDLHSNDLTQLSSREQLSALMDSALPADQTRFLLRRLRHDATLAECWDRWRIAGEVMRGLAPAQRLPSDFASRVSAALHGGPVAAPAARSARTPAWLRWGGGMVAASLVVAIGFAVRQPAADAPAAASMQLASTGAAAVDAPQAPASTMQVPPDAGNAAQALVAAAAVATTARPQRGARDGAQSRAIARTQPAVVRDAVREDGAANAFAVAGNDVQVPQPDIVTRPWPRSVLPQYASGGLTVGFGEHVRGNAPYNPFQVPPLAGVGMPATADATADATQGQATPADPQREAQARP